MLGICLYWSTLGQYEALNENVLSDASLTNMCIEMFLICIQNWIRFMICVLAYFVLTTRGDLYMMIISLIVVLTMCKLMLYIYSMYFIFQKQSKTALSVIYSHPKQLIYKPLMKHNKSLLWLVDQLLQVSKVA